VFEQVPTFSSNTAGFAVIAEGAQSVTVNFDEAYVKQPIITVSLTNNESPLLEGADKSLQNDIQAVEDDFTSSYFESDIKYIVTKKSAHGFTIVLNKHAPRELSFSWVAIAVSGAKTSYSEKEMKVVSEGTEVPSVPTDTVTTSSPPQIFCRCNQEHKSGY
jgi:frataxin-like iron-binding protein CyaY